MLWSCHQASSKANMIMPRESASYVLASHQKTQLRAVMSATLPHCRHENSTERAFPKYSAFTKAVQLHMVVSATLAYRRTCNTTEGARSHRLFLSRVISYMWWYQRL
jgi:hypothetical protein